MGEDAREEGGERTRSWYLTREEIERDSPSRRDGVGAAKEAELRSTYSSFLRHVCIRLQLPLITRATAILLCHRFYLRQSHAKNEWQTIATVCVFLASKIEDTPCSLKSVVIVAYETMYQKNTDAAKRIHQEEVLAKQKALILVGETLLLSTIRFDFNIQHAYEPLKLALNKLGISQKEVRQSAMSLINNTLPTTLVVQFEPHLIAAGSLLRAAKFHNIILPSQNGIVWRKVFDVDDFDENQLQAVIQQMTEIFEKRDPCSMGPIIKPVPTSTLTDKHQIKPTSTLSPTPINKKQIKPTPTLSPTPINKMQIKPTQTSIPTLTDKQQIKPAPTTTPMDKQHIKLIPAPTPTATDKQQIISTLDLRHTRSSRRSFRNSNTEARCVPVGSSLDNKFTGRSARYGENQYQRKCEENRYWRKYEENQYEENQYQRKYEENQYRINYEENQYRIKYEENQYRTKYEENQYRRKYWRCEENLYQRKHINHNLDTVVVDQRFELVKGMSGTLKAARGNEAGIRDLKKRRIQDVAGIPTPDYRYKCLEVREARYGGTNSSWRKQKVERR